MTTANGHARPVTLVPLSLPAHGPVSGWPQDDPGRRRRPALALPDGDTTIRILATAVVLAVAAIAAIVSYTHILELGRQHHQDGTAARLLPLSVDGLIAAASLVMVHAARKKLPVPRLARAMLVTGVIMTVAANVIYGIPSAWINPFMSALIGAAISAWPAVAFIGSVEMAVRFVRDARHGGGASEPAAAPVVTPRHDARHDGVPDDAVDDGGGGDDDGRPPSPDPSPSPSRSRQGGASAKAARALAVMRRHPGLSDAQVAVKAGVSESTARRARNGTAKTP